MNVTQEWENISGHISGHSHTSAYTTKTSTNRNTSYLSSLAAAGVPHDERHLVLFYRIHNLVALLGSRQRLAPPHARLQLRVRTPPQRIRLELPIQGRVPHETPLVRPSPTPPRPCGPCCTWTPVRICRPPRCSAISRPGALRRRNLGVPWTSPCSIALGASGVP